MTDEPTVREWRLPAATSPTVIGERVLALTMANPNQVFRVFRADDDLIVVAVEGERWILND